MLKTRANVKFFASMTGINVGVKAIFQGTKGSRFICTVDDDDDVITPVLEQKQSGFLTNFIPSLTHPMDIGVGLLKYDTHFVFGGREVAPRDPIKLEPNHSLVRIYKDVFIAYDKNIYEWVLTRIIVP
eukprot:gnl/Chilomastix_caulleri/7116.p1 GENE.gnl/Chilomastix_caulleri/7116~~gnl/Chilomastix_caulleri/7116.p1  ORF type:complete len:128 (-),score=27.40 gnl/Chilomastix_caulleri/7116:93-476(-)